MNKKARAAARRKKRQQLRKKERAESASGESNIPVVEEDETVEEVENVDEEEIMEDREDVILIELEKQPPQVRSLTGTVLKNARRCLNPIVFLEEDDVVYRADVE